MKFLSKFLQTSLLVLGLFFLSSLASNAQAYTNIYGDLTFLAQPGSKPGEVLLLWTDPSVVQNYNVFYGDTPGTYQWGAANIGKRASFTVSALEPGKKYYFVLAPVVAGVSEYASPEISGVAATGSTVQTSDEIEVKELKARIASIDNGPSTPPWYLTATPGPGTGEVRLTWNNDVSANQFDISYGDADGILRYGAQNVVQTDSLDKIANDHVIRGLVPGKLYFFTIHPEKDGTPLGFVFPVASYPAN